MAKSLLKPEVTEGLRLIVQSLFNGNRILDRIMDNLAVPLVMTHLEKTLHTPLAHKYPLIADEVVDYMHSRNQMSGYLQTMEEMTEYKSPLEAFNRYLSYQIELEELIKEVKEISNEASDDLTKKFLNNLLLKVSVYTNQALLLVDKAEMYGESKLAWMIMDDNADELLLPELSGLSGDD